MRRRDVLAGLATAAWGFGASPGMKAVLGQGSLPLVAVLRATGSESAKVNVQFRQALRLRRRSRA
jgi:hypothetical protein